MKHTITNILLAGILILLVLNFFKECPKPLIAAGKSADSCVTDRPSQTPEGYLHVVTHMSTEDVQVQQEIKRQDLQTETKELQKTLKQGR